MVPVGNRLEAGIERPFSSTRLKSAPMPRTVTLWPSPSAPTCAPAPERSMDTPVIRCSDSARLVSGNLPMSSATMASTTPSESRLIPADSIRLRRTPVTMTSSMMPASSASWATTGVTAEAPNASAMPPASGFILNVRLSTVMFSLCSRYVRNIFSYCLLNHCFY